MTLDRAELGGIGVALAFHIALVAALSLSLAGVSRPPEAPSMEVELVDAVGLEAAAPAPAPPAPAQSPEIGEAPIEAPSPAAAPSSAPAIAPPAPAPRIILTPVVDAAERRQRAIDQSRAKAKADAEAEKAAKAARTAPRVSRLGDDFLKGVAADAPSAPSKPAASAPVFSASAMASIQQAIRRQIQPCADRQVNPGEGANRIRVTLNLRLSRGGRLVRPPQVVRTAGVDEDNARFEDRVKDLAVAAYVGCAPLAGLPAALYQTAEGGWSNINMTYRLP